MLHALLIGMNTQFIKFDIKSFSAPSDEQQGAMPSQGSFRPTEEQYGEDFADHFNRAGGAVGTEESSSKDTNDLGSEKQSASELNTESDIASLFSVPFIEPLSTRPSDVSIRPVSDSWTNSSIELKPVDTSAEEVQLNEEPRPHSTNVDLVDWEAGFANSGPLRDNFTAVESAIAKYSSKNSSLGQTGNEPNANALEGVALPSENAAKSEENPLRNQKLPVQTGVSVASRIEDEDLLPLPKSSPVADKNNSIQSTDLRPPFSTSVQTHTAEKKHLNSSESQVGASKTISGDSEDGQIQNAIQLVGRSKEKTRGVDAVPTHMSPEKLQERASRESISIPARPAKEPGLLDSLNLRLANKIDVDHSAQRSNLNFDNIESELSGVGKSILTAEPSASSVDRLSSFNIPPHLANVTTATANPKPVVFDWASPNFAERFATEISDLTVSGDLKKFEINPRNLGRLEVALVARGNSEIIQIEAESLAAREVIVQHSQAIQDMLKAQGRSDLTIRVDHRDSAFADASNGGGEHLAQQNGTDAHEGRSDPQSGNGSNTASGLKSDPEETTDEGRYA